MSPFWRVPTIRPLAWRRQDLRRGEDSEVWAEVVRPADENSELVTSHLAAMTTGGLRSVATTDARRMATLQAELRDLTETAPKGQGQVLTQLTAPLADFHASLDAVSLGTEPMTDQTLASIKGLSARLHTASASAQASLARGRT